MNAQVERNLKLTEKQIEVFKKLWFVYGNNGVKHTLLNHELIQGFLQYKENRIYIYIENQQNMKKNGFQKQIDKHWLTDECIFVCENVLKENFETALKTAF